MLTTVAIVAVCTADECGHPAGDGQICLSHLGKIRAELRRMPELVDELLVTATRQDAVADRNPGAGGASDEPPLLYRPEPVEAGRDLHAVLEVWTDTVAETLGYTMADLGLRAAAQPDIRRLAPGMAGPERPPLAGIATYEERRPVRPHSGRFPSGHTLALAAWLDRHPDTIRTMPDAAAFTGELLDAVARVEYATDRPPSRVYLGKCGCDASAETGWSRAGELWAHPDAGSVTCRACQTVYVVADRRAELLDRSEQLLVSAELASRALPVLISGDVDLTPEVIRGWVRNHGLTQYRPHRDDPHRRIRYRVGEVLDHIAKARERSEERRRRAARPPLEDLTPEIAEIFEAARQAAAAAAAADRKPPA